MRDFRLFNNFVSAIFFEKILIFRRFQFEILIILRVYGIIPCKVSDRNDC